MQELAQGPIVIVEDDPSVSAALCRILRIAGFQSPRMFASAEDFLASDARGDAACLVLDVQLCGMTGFELYEVLQATSPPPPVIFMSAFDDVVSRRRAAAAGAVVFLAKPFFGLSLLDAVRRALAISAPPSS